MAAGRQKKRLTSSNLYEQNRGKKRKKNVDISDHVLNLRSHVHLEWDEILKTAVPRTEQIGITWKDLAPFIDSAPLGPLGLADVLAVPEEIFDLDSLKDVLSYEVWATCLSESERKLLTQFLPVGTAAEHAVQSLLVGVNHHFGNPFLKWSTSLCSGNLHPDNVRYMEKQARVNKKAYYVQLNSYHDDMLRLLKQWKERWSKCRNPEELWKELPVHKQESSPLSTERSEIIPFVKKDILQEVCISDVTKFMSYIKISKKQLQLVKGLRQSGDGIPPKSLNRVLGDIKSFQVEPYITFEEKEKRRLHDHWLRVAKIDIQMAFDRWRRRNLDREQWRKSLELELEKKKTELYKAVAMEVEIPPEESECTPEEQVDSEKSECHPSFELLDEDVDPILKSQHDHRLEHIPSLNHHQALSPSIPDQEFDGKGLAPANPKPMEISPAFVQFIGKIYQTEVMPDSMMSASPDKELWPPGQPGSYFQAAPSTHQYSPEIHPGQPVEQCASHLMNLERGVLEHEAGVNGLPFGSLTNPVNELLQPFPNGPRMLGSYSHGGNNGLNQSGIQFLMAVDGFPDSSRFMQFQEHQRMVDQRRSCEKELYVHPGMNKDYPDGRYTVQERFPSMDLRSLPTVLPSPSGSLASHNWLPECHRPSSSWHGAESSSSSGDQCFGDGGISTDGILFSVLSECQKLASRSSIDDSFIGSGQFLQGRNFAGDGLMSNERNIFGASLHHQFMGGATGYAATTTNPSNNSPWMNFSYQNQRPWDR